MVIDNYEKKKREISLIVEKLKSSVRNKYCLYCRSEIIEKNHHCKEIEQIGDKILRVCLEIGEKTEIIQELNSELLKNEEFAQNIKNKIIAYNI